MSSGISVNEALQAYLAGRATAAELIAVVAAEYYRETRNGKRDAWRPIMDVVERAHPGIVELARIQERPGFDVRLAERPFPKRHEAELRQAVEQVLHAFPVSRVPSPAEPPRTLNLFQRIVATVRRLFSA